MSMEFTSLHLGPIQTNCYLVKDTVTGKGAVIDPGDEPEKVLVAVAKMGMEPEVIMLTHGHFDHTGAVASLKKAWPGIKVYLHDGDVALGAVGNMPDVGERTHSYDEGDVVRVGDLTFVVYHTPGHTPGGVTLKCENVLFTGDTLFCRSMGRTDFPGGNDQLIFQSLKKLAQLPGDYQVCPGHEEFSTLEAERKFNYYMKAAMGR